MSNTSNRAMDTFKKVFAALTITATVLSLSGVAVIAPALAATPADYGLKEGDVVSAAGSDDPDVYIVNELGYKRLFLNPVIFGFYGHLGGFAAVKNVTPTTRDAFPTSGLFRNCETNDEKVYGVETTGEDTGILHWVNTTGAQAVADDANFFKKVFCINNNEFNWYAKGANYTSVNQVPSYARVPGTTTTTPGSVVASLSPSTPAATTVTLNAQGVEYLRIKLTGTGTINSLTVKRVGAGAVGDFDNVYLYEGARRLTTGKSLSSSTGEATFTSIDSAKGIVVSGTKEISVVGDLSAASGGNVDAFELTAMTLSSGTASGMPIRGNNLTTSGASSGGVTVTKVGSLPNPNVGAKQAEITEFKLTANTEAASVKRLALLQSGTLKPADITNIKLKAGTSEWSGTIDSAGYITVDMGSGYTIVKGGEAVFKLYADIAGKAAEDINLYFESITDILAVGDQYGFGMAVTNTAGAGLTSTAGDFHDVTLQGGVVTITLDSTLSASNIGTDTNDTVLMRYSITAATNIEVRQTEFDLCEDAAADGTFDDSNNASGWGDLEDFKVTDIDTGVVIIGPQDGTAFTASGTGNCGGANDGAEKQFTDTYELAAGKTNNYKVTADIKTGNTDVGVALTAGEIIKVVLDDFTDDTPSVSVMKYAGTTTAVADADIVPQADMSGPSMTLQSSSLALGLSSAVNDQTFVRGTKDVSAVGITFNAAQASDLKVTDIILTGYVDDDGSGTATAGSEGANDVNVAGLVTAVKIYEAESGTLLSASPSSNQLSNTTGTVTFNNLNWNIPAGATKTLLVKVDLSANPTSAAGSDYFYFDINTTSDVTALDSSSKTVNPSSTTVDPNGGATIANAVRVQVANSGSMTVAVNTSATPIKHAVYWGQTAATEGVWRFTSTNEGQYLEKVQFGEDDAGGTQDTDFATNAKAIYLEYKNKAGQTLTASGSPSSTGTISFGFAGDLRPYVPKDGSLDVTLKADYKTKAEGATSGKVWDLAFIGDSGTGTNTFKAIGEGSGVVLQGNSTGITDQDLADSSVNTRNYRVFPEFTLISPSSTKLNTVDPVATFTITAKGLADSRLFFDNTSAGTKALSSGSLIFEVVASGVGANDVDVTMKDSAGVTYDTATITNATLSSPHASLTLNFDSLDLEIQGGTSKTLMIYLDSISNLNTPVNTSAGVAADYFQLVLRDDENGLVNWVDNSTNASTDADTASTAGFLRNLPMAGYQFTAQ